MFAVTPISSPGCEYQFGLYPASDACSTTYIKCIHGHPQEEHCDAGLAYDAKSHTCVWPDQLLPYCNPEEIVGFKCPHKVPSHSAAAKFWPYPRSVLFKIKSSHRHYIFCKFIPWLTQTSTISTISDLYTYTNAHGAHFSIDIFYFVESVFFVALILRSACRCLFQQRITIGKNLNYLNCV